jgi:hypothetical protein
MVYAEKYVGFWLAYLLPTVLFFAAPVVLILCKKHYKLTPPTGNVFAKFWHLYFFALKGRWSPNPVKLYKNMSDANLWERAKPSKIPADQRPIWMTFDDAWVDEVRRGLKACSVFVWYPIYWLSYSQMTGNLTSQAATMQLGGVPNDSKISRQIISPPDICSYPKSQSTLHYHHDSNHGFCDISSSAESEVEPNSDQAHHGGLFLRVGCHGGGVCDSDLYLPSQSLR